MAVKGMNQMERLIKMPALKALYGSLIIVAFWYVLHIALRSGLVPGPYETLVEFIRLLGGELPAHIGVSFFRIVAAVGLSLVIGVPLGLWTGLSSSADAVISPIAYILYPIPKIAFLPVFMVILGMGNLSKIILIFTIIIFQVLLSVRDGVKEIPAELFYSVRTLGLNRRQVYINLVLPAVLPKIMSSLRTSIGVSIAVLFFGENFATSYGIGYFIMNAWAMVDYVGMFAGILALSIMGILIFTFIDFLEKKLCPWIFLKNQRST